MNLAENALRGESQLNPAPHKLPRLLIVDDQPINIRTLHALFKDECEIFMALTGQEALDKCRELLPDLVLLDVVMPGISGYDVCQEMKNDPLLRDIPVIFITANQDAADEVHGFQIGGVDFIHKPINPVITQVRVHTHLKLKQQADLLSMVALTDGLTSLANRRRFDQDLHTTWLQGMRDQSPLSIIMLDVDYFKRFNDYYGHQMGDSCLQQVAGAIRRALLRPHDLAARYGGEEFACILPRTSYDGAMDVAQRIKDNVDKLAIEHLDSDASRTITVSVGLATTIPRREPMDSEFLVKAADVELYKAKNNGRARISAIELSIHPPSPVADQN